jgi:hypothetical protein
MRKRIGKYSSPFVGDDGGEPDGVVRDDFPFHPVDGSGHLLGPRASPIKDAELADEVKAIESGTASNNEARRLRRATIGRRYALPAQTDAVGITDHFGGLDHPLDRRMQGRPSSLIQRRASA